MVCLAWAMLIQPNRHRKECHLQKKKIADATVQPILFDWQVIWKQREMQHRQINILRWTFFAVCIWVYAFPSVCVCVYVCPCVWVCVCQQSIDELSTMLNGTVLAAETAGPNLRVRDKRPSQLWAGERTSHQRRGDSTGKQLAEGAAVDERLDTQVCERRVAGWNPSAGWDSRPSLINIHKDISEASLSANQ